MAPAFLGKCHLLSIEWRGGVGRDARDTRRVKNSAVPTMLFQDILLTGASLRLVVLQSDPQTRAGLQTVSTEIKGKFLDTFIASWHCCIGKFMIGGLASLKGR